jgi:hypothetical protein
MNIDGCYDYMMDFVFFTFYVVLVTPTPFQFFAPFHIGGILGTESMEKLIAGFEMADVCILQAYESASCMMNNEFYNASGNILILEREVNFSSVNKARDLREDAKGAKSIRRDCDYFPIYTVSFCQLANVDNAPFQPDDRPSPPWIRFGYLISSTYKISTFQH